MTEQDKQDQDQQDQGFQQEGGDYASDDMNNRTLEELMESGELPDDPHELERMLGFDSNDKGQFADDKASGTDDTSADTASKQDDTSTDDSAAGTTGSEDKDTPAADDKPATDENKPAASTTDDKATTAGLDDAKKDDKGDDKTADAGEVVPDGVASRDGKHVIPYGVLQSERRRAAAAEERNRTLEEELRQLRTGQSQVDQTAAGAKDQLDRAEEKQQKLFDRYGIDAKELTLKDDGTLDLDALRKEFPDEIVNVIAAQNQLVTKLAGKIDELNERSEALAQREEAITRDTIQDAIDATPALAEIQAEGGRRWNIALSIDKDLRADPDWQDAPYRVRFAEVAHLLAGGAPRAPADVEAALRVATTPKPDPKPDPKPAPTDSQPGNPQDRAAEILDKNAQTTAPHTHSDLPAGERPAQHGIDRLEQMDPTQLEQAFENADDPDELINRMLR